MADEKLVDRIGSLLKKGADEKWVREKLAGEGWSKEDINGAMAVYALSNKPIGSNLMNRWEDSRGKQQSERAKNMFRVLLYLILLAALIAGVDYYNLAMPFGHTLNIKSALDGFMGSIISGLP